MKPETTYRRTMTGCTREVPAEFLRILAQCTESKVSVNVYEDGATVMLQLFAGEESVYLVQTIRGFDNHFAFHVFSRTDPCFGSINPKNIEVRHMDLDWDTKWEEVPMTEEEVNGACVMCMTVDHSKCTDPACTCCHGKGGNA